MHDAAWDDLLAAKPAGWFVGQPAYNELNGEWEIHAFDAASPARNGLRAREWTTIGPTEEQCIRSMAFCLREIAEGRAPK